MTENMTHESSIQWLLVRGSQIKSINACRLWIKDTYWIYLSSALTIHT